MSEKTLSQLFDDAEEIGMIGSPSSTSELALDILGQSVYKNLVGELAMFRYMQDNSPHYALGQIHEIHLRNRPLEDPVIRSIVRQRAQLEGISADQDTHLGEMNINAVFSLVENDEYKGSTLGTVPDTGTHIRLVNDPFLDKLLKPYKDQIFYLGTVYGSTPRLPLWFKHFGKKEDGGLGEAYHLGVFGKTGSGKSVLARMILLAYARHPQMGLFVLDPMGEFSKGLKGSSIQITSMGEILSPQSLNAINRPYEVYNISNFRLDTWELFVELLSTFGFFNELGIKYGPYQEAAADYVAYFLRNSRNHKLNNLDDNALEASLDYLNDNIDRIYATPGPRRNVQGFISEAKDDLDNNRDNPAKRIWDRTINFFSSEGNKVSIQGIVSKSLNQQIHRPLVVVDLSEKPPGISDSIWENTIKPLLVKSFLNNLIFLSERSFKSDQSLNTLVVLDEAQKLAPRGSIRQERKDQIRNILTNAARTTRKYGLGWMFISQTLSSLDRDIIDSGLRSYFFGFGLGVGTEFQALRELVGGGGKDLELYRRFRDPGSSLTSESSEFSFMFTGPVSPLSSSGYPLFLSVFTNPDNFLKANQITV